MEPRAAVEAFAALSQETRIRLLLRLRAEPVGLSAGDLAAAVAVPASTLSFHLAALERGGLVRSARHGRQVIYRARAAGLRDLLGYAAEICGDPGQQTVEAPPFAAAFNVLFLCRRNSARSIIAEAILDRLGSGRFHAYSAGPQPAAAPSPEVVEMLRLRGHRVEDLRSKDWSEFARAGSARMDFVITLCDMPPRLRAPAFVGQAITGLWLLPDPGKFVGGARERAALLTELYGGIRRRLEEFCRLSFDRLDRLAVQERINAIGGNQPAAGGSIA
ncbi:MAG: metalloregulator ArsR/SmtB family transcription factor [Alphaproteobacteria bacterium]|nr:metalloregulator ArsR/SmtB family transcription factor [Alphaproteobacteria bacterium]